jgi:hypothetical protein
MFLSVAILGSQAVKKHRKTCEEAEDYLGNLGFTTRVSVIRVVTELSQGTTLPVLNGDRFWFSLNEDAEFVVQE